MRMWMIAGLAVSLSHLAHGQVCQPDTALGMEYETSLAISPANPNLMAVVSSTSGFLGPVLRMSYDGGQSWTSAIGSAVPTGYFAGPDPSVTFDSQGRCFWAYYGSINSISGSPDCQPLQSGFCNTGCIHTIVVEVIPGSPPSGAPTLGTPHVATVGVPSRNDAPWICADSWPGSPFQDRLYVAWVERQTPCSSSSPIFNIRTSSSSDQGATWVLNATPLSVNTNCGGTGQPACDGFVFPVHVTVAPNGYAYVAYHSQPGWTGDIQETNPDGLSGRIFVVRSTDGGATWPQRTAVTAIGGADVSQGCPGPLDIPGSSFRNSGSWWPWIVADPVRVGHVYVVYCDDPDAHGSGDEANVYIVRSQDHGVTWGSPILVEAGPNQSFQVLPCAAMDRQTGCLAIAWYDNRAFQVDLNGDYLLDLWFTMSTDGGLTFTSPHQISDNTMNPTLSIQSTDCGHPIGEYMGIAIANDDVHFTWMGDGASSLQIMHTTAPSQCLCCPWDLNGDGSVGGVDLGILIGAWMTDPCGPPDFNNDGVVDGVDLGNLTFHWEACPTCGSK